MKPTLKDKKRYLLFKIHTQKDLDLQKLTYDIIYKFFGIKGVVEYNIVIKEIENINKYVVIRCIAGKEHEVIFYFLIANSYFGAQIRFELKKISGTIAGLGIKKPLNKPKIK
jgi:RNase P/RNase MRP subunit POP5